jgi:hypothetical protein
VIRSPWPGTIYPPAQCYGNNSQHRIKANANCGWNGQYPDGHSWTLGYEMNGCGANNYEIDTCGREVLHKSRTVFLFFSRMNCAHCLVGLALIITLHRCIVYTQEILYPFMTMFMNLIFCHCIDMNHATHELRDLPATRMHLISAGCAARS